MSYYIPVTGLSVYPNNGSWTGYWDSMSRFETYDCFSFSSADFHNPLYTRFETVSGMNVVDFKDQVIAQQMHPINMGIYEMSSRVVRDTSTNSLYLSVGQSGCGVFFKLYQQS